MLDGLIVLYCLVAVLLGVYGFMTWLCRRGQARLRCENRELLARFYGSTDPLAVMHTVAERLPTVTTQIPLYNERTVAERVIDAVAAFRYPPGKHRIQVLDDSDDQTHELVARKVAALRARGVDIEHVTRADRTGYKAGALRHGMRRTDSALLAIFDADFVPEPDFLLRAVPYFVLEPRLGFVQGRWEHLNRDESLLTGLVAMGIDGHFMIEQTARCASGLFLNFNGTAGVFRKAAILDAGNWQDDTLTEDMDLSYRMQFQGWTCRYLPDVAAPAEIPANVNAFKSQQFRWAKGSIQTARKLLPRLLASDARLMAKVQAVLHLTHYTVHPLMAFLAAMAVPIMLIRGFGSVDHAYLLMGLFLLLTASGPSAMYLQAQHGLGRSVWKALARIPLMVCFGCGLAINNTRAVTEAFLGRSSGFVRTPKRGSGGGAYRVRANPLLFAELAAGVWCSIGVLAYFGHAQFLIGQFMLVYALGFSSMAALSWLHGRKGAE